MGIFKPKGKTIQNPDDVNSDEFLIFSNQIKSGPFPVEEIVEKIFAGEISSEDMIKNGNTWCAIRNMEWAKNVFDMLQEETKQESIDDETVFPQEELSTGENITCPHCWHRFKTSQINFIAKHIDLIGDPILGPEAPMRFLPLSFNEQGYAIDARGMVCQDMACPHCHLRIPEAIIDIPSSLFSIVGAPASGKSYYLTAMVWQLRNILARKFDYSFADTDATFNTVLNNYEQILFLNREGNSYVALPKTELQGNDFSNQILLNGMSVDLPLPFIFTLNPFPSNTQSQKENGGLRNIILYDNAGEHFEPGRDQVTNLATQHLIFSDSIAFLYDPIKDKRLVSKCDSRDPQVAQVSRGANQLVLLNEMISRIKKYSGLKSNERYNKPLILVIPKYDAWEKAFPLELKSLDFTYYSSDEMAYYLDIGVITSVSYAMREMLLDISPEVVATCEAFFSTVYFVPVSALGEMPEYDQERDMIAIRPQDLKPVWAEVPMLLQFWHSGLLPAVISGIDEAEPVTDFKFVNDQMLYVLPGEKERLSVPHIYWERWVFSLKLNKYIMFPKNPEMVQPVSQEKNSAASDDFWKQ